MIRIFLGLILLVHISYAHTELSLMLGKKEYTNSKTKQDGKTSKIKVLHKDKANTFVFGVSEDKVNRTHPITKLALKTLEVEKYNILYKYNLNQKAHVKANFIKVIDNLAPTDQGKIYGIGATYKFPKAISTKLDYYKSDYKQFNVNQYDLTFSKGFKLDSVKGKLTIIGKSIHIDGNKYANYTFNKKDYFTTGLKLALNYNSYMFQASTFLGKRAFTVLNDGQSVQHHAMQQDETYILALAKKFQDFKIIARYIYQNGKELPENQDNVDSEVFAIALNYKF